MKLLITSVFSFAAITLSLNSIAVANDPTFKIEDRNCSGAAGDSTQNNPAQCPIARVDLIVNDQIETSLIYSKDLGQEKVRAHFAETGEMIKLNRADLGKALSCGAYLKDKATEDKHNAVSNAAANVVAGGGLVTLLAAVLFPPSVVITVPLTVTAATVGIGVKIRGEYSRISETAEGAINKIRQEINSAFNSASNSSTKSIEVIVDPQAHAIFWQSISLWLNGDPKMTQCMGLN